MSPIVLIVLDGFGYSAIEKGNAAAQAQTPTFDMLDASYPTGLLQASGIAVGLPWNEPGNSEVGHMTMGTGQIRYQPEERINRAIKNGSFFKNRALIQAAEHTKKHTSALHIMGLLGSGSVHSSIEHLWALIELARNEDVPRIFLHLFLDGKDSPPQEGADLIEHVEKHIENMPAVQIATVIGRHHAMDRDKRWERTQKTYELLTAGTGIPTAQPAVVVREQYAKNITDEFIEPLVVIRNTAQRPAVVSKNDALIFFNFREDRARQLSYAFADPQRVEGFSPEPPQNLFFVTFTQYEKDLSAEAAFPPADIRYNLSQLIARAGKKQLKIAETEKYAHVTYFFNGGSEEKLPGEKHILVESEKVEDFSKTPAMRAKEITKNIVTAATGGEYDFILANFANADMLGHTGNITAAIKAVETLDASIKKVVKAVEKAGGTLILTADHGNAEYMLDTYTGKVLTEHSSNPVPYWIVGKRFKKEPPAELPAAKEVVGILPDITVTVLVLLGIHVPVELDGKSLLRA